MGKNQAAERRRYIRLDSVFPVEIYCNDPQAGQRPVLIQAFTRDVSAGGLCLTVNNPDPTFLSFAQTAPRFDVSIDIPLSARPVEARVRVAWNDVKQLSRYKQLVIGVQFETITQQDKDRIVGTARKMMWLPKAGVVLILLLALLLAFTNYRTAELRARNAQLIEQFYRAQEESELYKRSVGKMDRKFGDLRGRIDENEKLIATLKAQLGGMGPADVEALRNEKARLEENLAAALGEKSVLEDQLKGVLERKEKASKLLDEASREKRKLGEAATENMYQWLATHRNRFTGLVMSYEGDPAIKDWAFTYDQSLAAQAFLIGGDRSKADSILTFFKSNAQKRSGGYVNAYNFMTGTPAEEVVHLGPNIWIGIAAAQYSLRTDDKTYLGMAEDVARWVISLKDAEGGIRGGPDLTWYSTEHNLDAYALFNMLYKLTGKEAYRTEMQRTLAWIKDNTYSKKEGRMNRGKGDATIATDTLAWAIAAIGPEELVRQGMDPDAIMSFAEEHCLVTTSFTRPDGSTIELKGFDFAKSRNIARNGVISSEWTAQMAISYQVMAAYYKKTGDVEKAQGYSQKADLYLGELDKMVVSSPSPSGQGAGCLPYASQPNADTGHGWRTPNGEHTGCVSGTAYAIFAKRGYNPLAPE